MVALAALASSPLAGTHVHRYADHDHPEHRHGPALHSHEPHGHHHAPAAPEPLRLAPCDPADHAVTLQAAGGTAVSHHEGTPAVLEDGPGTFVRPRPIPIRLAEVRVHGPPPRTRSSPRAPPVVFPA
jgi:hypothetical protein